MKRFFKYTLPLFVLLFALLSAQAFAAEHPAVSDRVAIFSEEEIEALTQKSKELEETYKTSVYVLVVPNLGGRLIRNFADEYFDDNALGYGDTDDGALLVISMKSGNREFYFTLGGNEIALSSAKREDSVLDVMQEYFSNENYFDGTMAFYSMIEENHLHPPVPAEDGNSSGHSFDPSRLLIAGGIGILIAGIAVLIMRKSMRPVELADNAAGYLVQGSFHLRGQHEIFVSREVHRTPRNTDSGGNGHSHTSSSGHSHSGGGRSF